MELMAAGVAVAGGVGVRDATGGIRLARCGGGEPGPLARVKGKKRKSECEGKKKKKKKKKEKEKKRKVLHVYDLRGPLPPAWGWVLGGAR